ncbi:hypothetical protein EIP86_008077 [Pleurotus ostreatoroseus]|nr:hypothetical protein EIP86_008077 [Pleurotus ostreatoroseus]
MLDYAAESDFSMQPGWLTVEATMSDESSSMQDTTLHDYAESIEVDMEPHVEDEEMTEYDMLDEGAIDENQHAFSHDAELLDIEVTDPQTATSMPPSLLPTPIIPPATFARQSLTPVLGAAEPLATAESFHPVPVDEHVIAASGSAPEFHHAQAHSPSPHFTVGEGVSAEDPAALDTSNDAGATEIAPASADVATFSNTEETAPAVGISEEADAVAGDLEDKGAAVPEVIANGDIVAKDAEDVESVPRLEVPQADVQQDPTEYVEESGDVAAPEPAEEAHYSNGDDPHEISDGVYIDPPPAVLLSLTTSTGSVDCTMFNQPHTSRSQSPHEYASSSASTEPVLLLHEHPTLYYEPLSNVFETLRQEETVRNIAEFADSELVLDAYDLDLRISEDNVYAREVTIHELNVLHDGIDLRGPLRLRLTSSSPRFITRYHSLRDQIAQLTLEINGEASAYDEQPAHESYIEPTSEYYSAHEDSLAETEVPQNDSYAEHDEAPTQEYQDDAAYQEETLADQENEQQESSDNSKDVSAPAVQGDNELEEQPETYAEADENAGTDRADDAHEEYGTEVTAEEAAEGLDADEVHRYADAEDGGDYTDYAQNVADDEERYGEDLPAEEGGDASTEAHYAEAADASTEAQYLDAVEVSEADAEGETDEAVEPTSALDAEAPVEETEGKSFYRKLQTHEGGEVLDNNSFEDVTSPQAETDNATTVDYPDYPEVEQLEEYDDSDTEDAHDRAEDLQDGEWDELEDPEAPLEESLYEYDDALSKDSSVTLSSTRSKRSREEDDVDEDTQQGVPESPGKIRVYDYEVFTFCRWLTSPRFPRYEKSEGQLIGALLCKMKSTLCGLGIRPCGTALGVLPRAGPG